MPESPAERVRANADAYADWCRTTAGDDPSAIFAFHAGADWIRVTSHARIAALAAELQRTSRILHARTCRLKDETQSWLECTEESCVEVRDFLLAQDGGDGS